MELFCEDDRLNISPAYLRPGFAFGGSCLPKDLRALLYLGADATTSTCRCSSGRRTRTSSRSSDVVDRVLANGGRNVALLGLSFKMQTDDLRESPNVTLAETLIGKGFDVRIYDPIVNPARLVGANRSYVESKLPHLQPAARPTPPKRRSTVPTSRSSRPPTDRAVVDAARRVSTRRAIIDISTVGSETSTRRRTARLPSDGDGSDRRCRTRTSSAAAARPDHRAEPPGAVRPARLARVPGAASTPGYEVTSCARRRRATRRTRCSTASTLHKYRPCPPARGAFGYVVEYAYSLAMTPWLDRARVSAGGRFDVIQTCNPPDIFWTSGIALRRADRRAGSSSTSTTCARSCSSRAFRTVPRRSLREACGCLERRTYRAADHVIATNESYARVAIDRAADAAERSPSCAPVPTPTGCGEATGPSAAPPGRRYPRRLPRRDGTAGRRRLRAARRRRDRPRARPHRHRLHADGHRRLLRRARRACATSSGSATTSSSPAGCPTTSSRACCRPPTSGCRPIRRTR